MIKRIKDLRKTNRGNTFPRTESQINSAIKRMLFDNPMKKPLNQMKQSMRMMDNHLWMDRLSKRFKQQPSSMDGENKGETK